tara:strand:- start:119 stop:889 length:771 start_codon:yes stop_codon:yes gene_type:complete
MNIEEKLKDLIKGKKVALVGPSDYINKELDESHGDYINKHDIVIRLNNMIYMEDKELEEKFYGTKYDIIASAFWHHNNMGEDVDQWKHKRFLDPTSYENLKENTILFECFARNLYVEVYHKFKPIIDKKNITYGNSSPEFYWKTLNLLKQISPTLTKSPTTGMMMLGMILLMEPRKLYVTGLSCYLDKKHNAYYDNYFLGNYIEKKKDYFDGKTFEYNKGKAVHHPYEDEQKILSWLVKNKKIKVDKYLASLVKNI